MAGETDTLLWRVIDHYVPEARAAVDMANVHAVSVDETSSRRGHGYITLFIDLNARRLLLLFATPGKDAKTFEKISGDLQVHGGSAEAITNMGTGLSPAVQKEAAEHLPNAEITFDRFNLMNLVNEAVVVVRKGEVLTLLDLVKTRWHWLKNDSNLKVEQKKKLQNSLKKDQNLKTAQAYQFWLTFQDIFTVKNRHQGATARKAWIENIKNSGLSPMVKVVYTIMNHWVGVLRWFESQITNGILEGFNSLIQSAKTRRGYRTYKTFINTACLILDKPDLRLST